MLSSYFRYTILIAIGLIVAALTIDLSPQIKQIWIGNSVNRDTSSLVRLAWYLSLRSADVATRLLPVACFFGVLASEITLTLTRQRQIIWNTGRSPLQCLVPALIFGVLAGGIQFGLDGYLRPAAVSAQIAERLGEYGERYDRRPSGRRLWLVGGNSLIHAAIDFGQPPAMYNVAIYRFNNEGRLDEIILSSSAKPASDGQTWLLENGRSWSMTTGANPASGLGDETTATTEVQELKVDPLWLSHFGINAMFLPQNVLRALANLRSGFDPSPYRTWLQIRYSDLILPLGMAMLAASLALTLLASSAKLSAVFGITLAGYAGHISMRVFSLLGTYDYVSPVAAGWFTPVLQLTIAAAVVTSPMWRRTLIDKLYQTKQAAG